MSIDNSKKSPRLLQSRRYTHDTFTDAQEAFTSVLDINSDEVYVDQNLIPSSSIPYGTSGDNLSIYSSGGQQVMKYYYRYKMTKSSTNTEVWFFTTGTTAGIDAQLIDSNQQVNFISPKYSIPSLSTANAEDATPGYGVKVFVSTNSSSPSAGDQISSSKFVFDYKTGVLQFVLTADAPTVSQYVYISAYQYVGRVLSSSLTTLTSNNTNLSSSVATTTLNLSSSVSSSIGSLSSSIATTTLNLSSSVSSSIGSLSSSIASINNTQNGRLDSLETASGSIRTNFNTFTSSYNTSSFSGSFKGDGSQLYNIPSSGITGLSLFQIASGSATASISPNNGLVVNTDTTITGSLNVSGIITAKEIHTSIVTSSVLYESGSTRFGDTADDTHSFTGSVLINGLLGVNRITSLSGSNVTVESSNLLVPNGGIFSSFNIQASGSVLANIVSASAFSGSGASLINVPFRITGSDVDGNQSDKTFTKLHFDSDTGLNVSESAPGTAFISIGSHFKDIFVSGSPILSATGSDAFEVIGAGGLGITTSITDTNGNGYVKELTISATGLSSSLNNRMDTITGSITILSSSLDSRINSITASSGGVSAIYIGDEGSTQGTASYFDFIGTGVSATVNAGTASITINGGGGGGSAVQGASQTYTQSSNATTWSIDHSINSRTPVVEIYDNNYNVIIPTGIYNPGAYQTLVYFDVAQRGYAIISTGGNLSVDGANAILDQSSSSSTWTFTHNLGTKYPVFNIFDSNDDVIIPQRIHVVDENSAVIYFSSSRTGKAIASVGGDVRSAISSSVSISSSFATNANFLDGLDSVSFVQTGSFQSYTSSFSSSVATTTSGLTSTITSLSSSLTSSIGSLSSSIATTTSGLSSSIGSLSSSIATTTSDLSSSVGSLSSSVASINNTQNGRLDSLETASGSIRTDFNSFTSSYTTVSGSLDSRLDVLEAYSGSQLVPSSSMSFRTLETSVYCKNVTGIQINKGTVVRIVGAVGDNPLIAPADLLTEGNSANTLGITTQNIPNDNFGMVITEGILLGVNTDGMTAGALLYLGANGTFTTTPPAAPNHGVRLGEVLRVQQNNGSIYVRIDNGIELNEAHDVIYTGITHGDLLIRSGSVWKNGKSLQGDYVVTGSLTITQNLTVLGSSSLVYVTSSQLAVSASTISVNVFEPAERFGGLKIYDSGSSNATASLLWDSLNNHFIYQNVSGSDYSGGMLLAGPRNTGSLGDEVGLINGRIAKSVGGDHLDNSIISETGTTITIAGNLVANSISGAFDFYGLVNKPTLVSGSSQIIYSGLTGIPSGIVSSSSQITYSGLTGIPSGIVSGSSQVLNDSGIYSSSAQIQGNIYTPGSSFTFQDLLLGAGTTSGKITTDGSKYISIMPTYNVESTRFWPNGNVTIQNAGDYVDNGFRLEVSGSVRIVGNTQITGSINVTNGITGSIDFSNITNIPTLVSGSSQISYTGITNIPSGIVSGSSQLTGSYDTRYVLSGSITQTTWDNIANKPSGLVSGSSQVAYSGLTGIPSGIVSGSSQLTGSYDTRYVLSGSITQTTWDNIASKPSGIVSGSSQIIGLGFATTGSYLTTGSNSLVGNQNINGNLSVTGSVVISGSLDLSNANVGNSRYLHTQGSSSTTWNIVHNLNYLYPNITVYDDTNKIMLPDEVTSIDLNTTQVTFAIAESGHALASVGGISPNAADRYLHTQTSATGSWVIDHNIGYKYVTVNVYDNNDEQLVPLKISAVSANRTQIDFSLPTSGNATITVGGPRVTTTSLFNQTGSYYNATTNIGITGSLVVTGDVDAFNFNTTSDRKLKTNLVRIEGALDKIEKLNGYTFDWLEEYSEDRTRQIGMVADEVYEVQPELISHRNIVLSNKEEKIKLLDYSKVTALLLEAIKELNDKVTKLENKKKKK